MLEQLGGEVGCLRLATEFYSRVAENTDLKPLFPGKSFRCATEEFSAFLIQFLDGDESRTQYRWWLSLKESHGRFQISEHQRSVWLSLMREAIHAVLESPETQQALQQFFLTASAYIVGKAEVEIDEPELKQRWEHQKTLDHIVECLIAGRDSQAMELSLQFLAKPGVFVGILARMMEMGREGLNDFVLARVMEDDKIKNHAYNGRFLIHYASGYRCLPVVQQLLRGGVNPDTLDSGGHTALYRTPSTRASSDTASVVEALVQAGATVDHSGGVIQATALHQAARFGDLFAARALIAAGANPRARDKKGLTPIDRAVSSKRRQVAEYLARM